MTTHFIPKNFDFWNSSYLPDGSKVEQKLSNNRFKNSIFFFVNVIWDEPRREKTNIPSLRRSAHPRSLIRVSRLSRMIKLFILGYPICARWDSDQTARMIWIFAWCKCPKVKFLTSVLVGTTSCRLIFHVHSAKCWYINKNCEILDIANINVTSFNMSIIIITHHNNMSYVRKRNFGHVRQAKIQTSLRIRAVWSEFPLGAFLIA